jgi:CxxC motif-containing protein (DUF1111 family)
MRSRLYSCRISTFLHTSVLAAFTAFMALPFGAPNARAQTATDPGVRRINWCQTCPDGSGEFVSIAAGDSADLNTYQQQLEAPMTNFIEEVNRVAGGTAVKRVGLGGTFDSNSCTSCHFYPEPGGSSPLVPLNGTSSANQLFDVYQLMGAQNVMPFFETMQGPTVVARFPYQSDLVTPDGHVHQLFTITGRTDAGTCSIQQPDFNAASAESNLIFRQTTPFFGGGLIEIINDSDIIANMAANLTEKISLGISGTANISGDDGSVTRFGWKAQKRSLILFAGEAYNVEEGIDNEFFPNKLNETPGCTPPFPEGPPNGNGTQGVPDDRTDWAILPATGYLMPGDPERFGIFGRFLAGPVPSTSSGQYGAGPKAGCPNQANNGASCVNGQAQFNSVGCVLCHTTSFTTPQSSIAALSGVTVSLFSDLLVHHMGVCDADNVTQGLATGDEFRTAPLWGVGQRGFFMHDGGLNRHDGVPNANIVQAVEDHLCDVTSAQYGPSEANAVINRFNKLSPADQQDLINFLRTL